MPIDYEKALTLTSRDEAFSYGDKDTMLYALGVGMGADPLDTRELPFVFENGLKVLPTQTTMMAWGAGLTHMLGLNFLMVVHGEQRIEIKKPLQSAADLLADWRVESIADKGPGKGAVIVTETTLKEKRSGEPFAILRTTIVARGDGGFGGPADAGAAPHPTPDREPDAVVEIKTRPDQALLYRLSGDRNPLHADPGFAKFAGFDRPILHGLCTYAITCRAVLATYCDYDPNRILAHDARFSAPVFPGETVVTRLWRDGNVVAFDAGVAERPGVTVIKNGRTLLGG